MKRRQRIAIIGAGPKALAIACKAKTLQDFGYEAKDIYIFEKNEVGAHWTGRHGFTNGEMPLGTAPEKDLGFPYQSSIGNKDLSNAFNKMMFNYSFHRYLMASAQLADWVDRGRPAYTHRDFAGYLKWVAQQIKASVHFNFNPVTQLEMHAKQWIVSTSSDQLKCDAVIVTGPGHPNIPFPFPQSSHIFDSESYWRSEDACEPSTLENVAIIGSGESAASIAWDLIQKHQHKLSIDIINRDGTIHARGESYSENRLYSNPDRYHWVDLDLNTKQKIINRTDRGVFSPEVVAALNQKANVHYCQGHVTGITQNKRCRLRIALQSTAPQVDKEYDKIILAMGFNKTSLLNNLLSTKTKRDLMRICKVNHLTYEALSPLISYDLSLAMLPAKLYLPTLSAIKQGPGFENLSCLGLLSDRVLGLNTIGVNLCQKVAS